MVGVMKRQPILSLIIASLLHTFLAHAQMPSQATTARAVARHPDLGKQGSAFNKEFHRRLKIYAAEDPKFLTDKDWPLKLADEVAGVIARYAPEPEIEFKVLLIIKRRSDTWHPLFLPVRAEMTEEDVRTARHCFEIQTPDMVHEATRGRVRFTPTVIVSDTPLRAFSPTRLDSAEYLQQELLAELANHAKPGDYDSAGYYFLHYDPTSGYRAPRAGYGVGGYHAGVGMGLFAVSNAGKMNPRDEIFLHEWMHGLDGFYEGKKDVRLPRGALHGGNNYDARYSTARPWRTQDTFRGYMTWYQDILNGEVPEAEGFSGHGSKAWRHGPIRDEGRKRGSWPRQEEPPRGGYPEWVHAMMRGDLSTAQLSPVELPGTNEVGPIMPGQQPWRLESWTKATTTHARQNAAGDESSFTLECDAADHAALAQDVSVQPATNYVFTAEVKTTRVEVTQQGGKLAVLLGAANCFTSVDLSGSAEWTPIVLPFTTRPGQTSATLRLQMGAAGSLTKGKAQFRNVMLRKVGYPTTRLLRAS